MSQEVEKGIELTLQDIMLRNEPHGNEEEDNKINIEEHTLIENENHLDVSFFKNLRH